MKNYNSASKVLYASVNELMDRMNVFFFFFFFTYTFLPSAVFAVIFFSVDGSALALITTVDNTAGAICRKIVQLAIIVKASFLYTLL